MNINYNLIFVLVLLIAGLMLVMKKWIPKSIVTYARSFFPVLLLVVLLRSFVFELFSIPSPSMMPGLVAGDRIIVAKYAYALRLPVLNIQLIATGPPQRGDVIVFRLPADLSTNYIKRLVGLPGDHITVLNNRIFINGKPAPIHPNGLYTGGFGFTGSPLATERFGDSQHVVMFANRHSTDFDAVVPEGHYFFMGDNRNDSQDSRFPTVGFIPNENLVGQAKRIIFSWHLPNLPAWSRILKAVN